ncbi:MAG: hypothetical protein ACM3WT_05780 [Bacillota bacterium]
MEEEQVNFLPGRAPRRDRDVEPDAGASDRIRPRLRWSVVGVRMLETLRALRTSIGARWRFLLLIPVLVACVVAAVALRAASVHLPYPVCVMISEYPDRPIKGVRGAAIAYEWVEWDGSKSVLAVFTRKPGSEVGPVAPLSIGAAHLAYTYGNVACGMTLPEAEQLIRSYACPLMRARLESGQYATLDEIAASFERQRYRLLPEEGYMMNRGKTRVEGGLASLVSGVGDDGAEVFRWSWDGRYYRRAIGEEEVRVSAVVVLYAQGGPNDSGAFPDGVFAGNRGPAVVYAGGRETKAYWTRYPLPVPITLEDEHGTLPLPGGPVWFHIVTSNAGYSVTTGGE